MILVREADIFLSESLRIFAERLSQAEIYTQQRTSVFGEILDAMQQSIFGLIEYLHPTA